MANKAGSGPSTRVLNKELGAAVKDFNTPILPSAKSENICFSSLAEDRVPLFDSCVPMKNFLQDFSVGDKTLPCCNQPLKDDLCLGLVRMCGSDRVHRDVGIDKDRRWRYPRSISSSIWPRPAVGNEYVAARRTAFNFASGSIAGRLLRASRSTRRTHSPTVRRSRFARRRMSDIS